MPWSTVESGEEPEAMPQANGLENKATQPTCAERAAELERQLAAALERIEALPVPVPDDYTERLTGYGWSYGWSYVVHYLEFVKFAGVLGDEWRVETIDEGALGTVRWTGYAHHAFYPIENAVPLHPGMLTIIAKFCERRTDERTEQTLSIARGVA